MSIHPLRVALDRVWPKLLFGAGWVVFGLTVVAGNRLPVPALFFGPTLMATALILMFRKNAQRRALDKP